MSNPESRPSTTSFNNPIQNSPTLLIFRRIELHHIAAATFHPNPPVLHTRGDQLYDKNSKTIMSDTMPPNMTIPVFDNSLCTIDTCPIDESFYEYRPSLAMNSVMIALFAISLLANAVQGVAYRTWTFAIAMVLGNICEFTVVWMIYQKRNVLMAFAAEVIGYIGRVFSYKDPFAMNPVLLLILSTIFPSNKDSSVLGSNHLSHDCPRVSCRRHLPLSLSYRHYLWNSPLTYCAHKLYTSLHYLRLHFVSTAGSRRWGR